MISLPFLHLELLFLQPIAATCQLARYMPLILTSVCFLGRDKAVEGASTQQSLSHSPLFSPVQQRIRGSISQELCRRKKAHPVTSYNCMDVLHQDH